MESSQANLSKKGRRRRDMKCKLTEMSKEELQGYIAKWAGRLTRYVQGSRNWQKVYHRIKRARKLLNQLSV